MPAMIQDTHCRSKDLVQEPVIMPSRGPALIANDMGEPALGVEHRLLPVLTTLLEDVFEANDAGLLMHRHSCPTDRASWNWRSNGRLVWHFQRCPTTLIPSARF